MTGKNENIEMMTSSSESVPKHDTIPYPGWMFWKRRRHLISVLAFFGFFNIYALRVNLSVAIVAMTNPYNKTLEDGSVIEVTDFEWDSATQGLLLSSFFYGYIVTQIPGGWLANRVGGHRVYVIGIAVTAVLTILTPPLANIHVYLLLAVRIIEGLFEGVTYPCIHAVWARWAPPLERSRLATFAFSGSYVGTVVSMPVCGLLAEHVGWPSIFYIFGAVGLVWCAVWWVVVKESPDVDPYITPEELKYIQATLGTSNTKNIVHPWKSFVTSLPVWSIVVAHFCENWGFYTLLTQLPKFMQETFHFELGKTGFLSALPYLCMAIILQFAGHIADHLVVRKILSITSVRKLFNCVAFLCQTIFMLCVTFIASTAGVVACLTIAVGLGAFAWCGFSVNHLDIAPAHASVLMGFGNTFATLPGIISPIITGYIVTDKSVEQWRIVFYIASAIYLSGCIFYGIFASGELQPWAKSGEEQELKKQQDKNSTANGAYENPALEMDPQTK